MIKRALHLSLAIAAGFGFAFSAQAQTVATDPVGFTTSQCLANTDTVVGIPFTRPPEFVGAVQSVSGSTITVSGNPFTQNQFVYVAGTQPKTYFVLISSHQSSNPKEGHYYTVTANGTNTITVDTEGESITTIQPSTQIVVAPYPTLSSVFPASDANVSFTPSASQFSRGTEILVPNYAGSGFNLSASTVYFFLNGAWRKVSAPAGNFNDDPFVNSGYFIVRNKANATTLTTLGSVLMKKSTIPLVTRTSTRQDNFVSLVRPVPVKLNDLGLITSGAFQPSSSAFNRTDELLVFNNAAPGINKSAATTYYYLNNAWRRTTAGATTDVGAEEIPANAGFIIRKAPTNDGATVFWTNAPTYVSN